MYAVTDNPNKEPSLYEIKQKASVTSMGGNSTRPFLWRLYNLVLCLAPTKKQPTDVRSVLPGHTSVANALVIFTSRAISSMLVKSGRMVFFSQWSFRIFI